jgi:hypothetical protein
MFVDPRYPIGEFIAKPAYSSTERTAMLEGLKLASVQLKTALEGLSDVQLDTPYRAGGWTVRQVAHHIPDSHVNAYIRIKLALTEIEPLIKPYDEESWVLLEDSKTVPLAVSVVFLEVVHLRLVAVLNSLSEADWAKTYLHPVGGLTSIEQALAAYDWHGRHHIAQITGLRQKNSW